MTSNLLARALAAFLLALLFAAYIHHDVQRMSREGREKFLARQEQRFNQTAVTGHPIAVAVFGSIFVIIPFLLCYELASLALSKVLKSSTYEAEKPAQNQVPPFS